MKDKHIIKFTEALKKHCKTDCDLNEIVFALKDVMTFMSELQGPLDSIIFNIREIEDIIRTHGNKEKLEVFQELSDCFIRGMIISGRNSNGISLIYQMEKDLNEIPELYQD